MNAFLRRGTMAAVLRRNRCLLVPGRKYNHGGQLTVRSDATRQRKSREFVVGIVAGLAGSCATFLYFLDESVKAMEHAISLPRYPWRFTGLLTSFDHAALRRGWTVYRTVCHTCHSLRYVRFLDLVDVLHTPEEAKAIAAEYEVDDGPDEEGNYYKRPAKLADKIPSPYPNEEAARAANLGAYPPDLTFMVYARVHGYDYLFNLLTGWRDPPAGVELGEGQSFNIYFPGGATSMAQMFFDGMVEYDDGTPATVSQMAKDVVEFLSWTASQEHDTRKIMTLKLLGIMSILLVTSASMYRRFWSHIRSRRLAYVPKRNY